MTNPAANNTCSPEVASPCPSCGAQHGFQCHALGFFEHRFIVPRCGDCGWMPSRHDYNVEEAVRTWNRRAPDGAREAALEARSSSLEEAVWSLEQTFDAIANLPTVQDRVNQALDAIHFVLAAKTGANNG